MANWANDLIADAALDFVADNGTRMFACSAQPATYEEASDTYLLASKTLTVGDGNGVYTKRDAVVAASGRELVIAQQQLTVTADGEANHVAICDSVNERVLLVRQLATARNVENGTTMTVEQLTHAIGDIQVVA